MNNYKHVTYEERILLEHLLQINPYRTLGEITNELKHSKPTWAREMELGKRAVWETDEHGVMIQRTKYFAIIAQRKSEQNYHHQRELKIRKDSNFLNYVCTMVKSKFSPYELVHLVDRCVINGESSETYRQKHQIKNVTSVASIYRAFNDSRVPELKRWMMLNEYRRRKKYLKTGKRQNGVSFLKINPSMLKRFKGSIWQCDTVLGKQEKGKSLFVLTNVFTKQEIILLLNSKTGNEVVKALDQLELEMGYKTFRKLFRVMIFDNGSEFWSIKMMERSALDYGRRRTACYFARPYRATDRALNENRNRIIRKAFPKKKSMKTLNSTMVIQWQNRMNRSPLKSLNGLTPNEYAKIYLFNRAVTL